MIPIYGLWERESGQEICTKFQKLSKRESKLGRVWGNFLPSISISRIFRTVIPTVWEHRVEGDPILDGMASQLGLLDLISQHVLTLLYWFTTLLIRGFPYSKLGATPGKKQALRPFKAGDFGKRPSTGRSRWTPHFKPTTGRPRDEASHFCLPNPNSWAGY